ncbi:MAG: AarF/ABC1/UbiB kinase family protein [Deltaproteobacteria bacterium]|nr:MAG: AarF/ABC1/UbiB kinase family protein [Deltaproteobacteria bacterium]
MQPTQRGDGIAAGPHALSAAARAGEGAAARCACAKPPARAWRFVKAYWVTFVVVASYLSARVQARFRSEAAMARVLRRKHLRNARRVERTILSLQGLFIKIGQLISIMTNFLPEEFRRQLEGLQDSVPPRPYRDIEARFREEFDGKTPHDLFTEFDEQPVASASIGQVHIARLPNGSKVAVKVQYPDIEDIVRSDLKTLRRIFRIVEWFLSYEGLDQVHAEISSMILDELDFRMEARNIDRIAENFLDRSDVAFPRVVDAYSTERVLTTLFEDGVKIGDVAALDARGIDRSAVARLVVELYCQQIFTDGVYHADPHPGNLLVRTDARGRPQIVFLDFGAVAEVSPAMRDGIIDLIQGGIARDTERIVRAMKSMGFVARGADNAVFERVIEYFHHQFQEHVHIESFNLKDLKFDPQKSLDNLADLRRMDISLRELTANFQVPREWILLERTLLLLTGLCTTLDPDMNPMTVIRPYLEKFVLGDDGDWSAFVVDTGKELALAAFALPGELRKFMTAAQRGELRVQFHNLERSTRVLYHLGQQAMLCAIGIAAAALAVVFEGRGEAGRADAAWWTMRVSAAMWLWAGWTGRRRLRRRR